MKLAQRRRLSVTFVGNGLEHKKRSVIIKHVPQTREGTPTVSILMVTLDRFDLLQRCVGSNLERAGDVHFEILSCDNGSTDKRVIDYVRDLNPYWHRLNPENEGYAPCLNQMLLRGRGEYFCIIDPDIELPYNWLQKLVTVNRAIPESGISGYFCVEVLHPAKVVNACEIRPGDVFGIKFFHRSMLDKVGYYRDEYTPYGLEDCDMLVRTRVAGFLNYYLGAGDTATHHGNDVGEQTPYRKAKWASLERLTPLYRENIARYKEPADCYIPAPEKWSEI